MVLAWQIADDSPHSPNFSPAKLFRYTVYKTSNSHSILESIQLCIQLLISGTYKLLSDYTFYSRAIARIGFLHVGIQIEYYEWYVHQ